jgi:hypothetical protein
MTGLSRASGGLLRLPGQARDRRWRFRHRQPFPDPRLEAALGGFELALAQATVEGRWRPLLREESIPHGELTLPPWTEAVAQTPSVGEINNSGLCSAVVPTAPGRFSGASPARSVDSLDDPTTNGCGRGFVRQRPWRPAAAGEE